MTNLTAGDVLERRVAPYSVGICMASACAAGDAEPAEVEREVNMNHPTGISSRWQISADPFLSGEPNPCPCNIDPERKHWLLEC